MEKEPTIYCSYNALVSIENLKPNPRNPNKHPEKQIEIALPNCKYKQKERRKREILSIIACCLITGVIVTPVIILLNITGLIKNSTVVFNTGFLIGLFSISTFFHSLSHKGLGAISVFHINLAAFRVKSCNRLIQKALFFQLVLHS